MRLQQQQQQMKGASQHGKKYVEISTIPKSKISGHGLGDIWADENDLDLNT